MTCLAIRLITLTLSCILLPTTCNGATIATDTVFGGTSGNDPGLEPIRIEDGPDHPTTVTFLDGAESGTVTVNENSLFVMEGGNVGYTFSVRDRAWAIIRGGTFACTITQCFLSAPNHEAVDNARIDVFTRTFFSSGGLVASDSATLHFWGRGLAVEKQTFSAYRFIGGEFADGTTAFGGFTILENASFVLHQVPEPSCGVVVGCGVAWGLFAAARRRT